MKPKSLIRTFFECVCLAGATATCTPPAVSCTTTPQNHTASCPSGHCPIVEDVEVRCNDYNFAAPGVRVAPAPNATWLATASEHDRMVFQISNGSSQRADASLPPGYVRTTMLLALGNEGTPQLATDATTFDGSTTPVSYPGGAELATYNNGTWTTSLAFENQESFVTPIDFEIGADGAPRIWAFGPYPSYTLATRAPSGAWTTTSVPLPSNYGSPRFSLSSAGEPVSFDLKANSIGNANELYARRGGVDTQLGSAQGYGDYAVTHALAPATATPRGPDFAAVTEHATDLRVSWPRAGGFFEVVLPATALPPPTPSSVPWNNVSCPAPAHFVGSGVNRSDFAIARTSDGAVWVAYVRTNYDLRLSYSKYCFEGPYCVCQGHTDADLTTAKLHLVRVATETFTVTEALALPVPPLQNRNAFLGGGSAARIIDIRGFGTDLAIALRTRTDLELGAAVRVLRVDTKLVPN